MYKDLGLIPRNFKNKINIARSCCLMPVILANWESEIGRIKFQSQLGQIVLKIPSPK
jgi:hypothetical protein